MLALYDVHSNGSTRWSHCKCQCSSCVELLSLWDDIGRHTEFTVTAPPPMRSAPIKTQAPMTQAPMTGNDDTGTSDTGTGDDDGTDDMKKLPPLPRHRGLSEESSTSAGSSRSSPDRIESPVGLIEDVLFKEDVAV